MSNMGYSGSNYDRFVENTNTSTLHKMKETYWTTKQAVIKKLGKKEDEHVVASDSQLDAKLEVFKAIQRSSMELLRVIEKYQDRLCVVSQEENTMGRLLKAHSNKDKTRAGKMMAAVGKAESNSAQERLALHNPLRRLYQEVETFRYRAVSDTLVTINRMESARTEYRGALLWMKNVSEELNPDMYKQLEKFRKVQSQVRKTKTRFDKLKLDVMQKVDLLAASRCNMFSHVLANYQTMLLHYWDKTSRTMTAVADSFKGYQYYEFNMLRELTETSKKLAQETSKDEKDEDGKLISVSEEQDARESSAFDENLLGDLRLNSNNQEQHAKTGNGTGGQDSDFGPFMDFTDDDTLLGVDDDDQDFAGKIREAAAKNKAVQHADGKKDHDLLADDMLAAPGDGMGVNDDAGKDDMELLNEILNASSSGNVGADDEFAKEWDSVFGTGATGRAGATSGGGASMMTGGDMLGGIGGSTGADGGLSGSMSSLSSSSLTSSGGQKKAPEFLPSSLLDIGMGQISAEAEPANQNKAASDKKKSKPQNLGKGLPPSADMSAWFNLFADLDPLSNPDAIGRQPADMTDA